MHAADIFGLSDPTLPPSRQAFVIRKCQEAVNLQTSGPALESTRLAASRNQRRAHRPGCPPWGQRCDRHREGTAENCREQRGNLLLVCPVGMDGHPCFLGYRCASDTWSLAPLERPLRLSPSSWLPRWVGASGSNCEADSVPMSITCM